MTDDLNNNRIREFISHIWAFKMLEPAQLEILTKLITVRRLAPPEVLWLQGQRVTQFTIVYSGKLRSVRLTSGGSEKLLSTLKPGHHFGLAEMITGATSAVTINAEEPSTLLCMDQKALRSELLSNADICYRLMQTMARAIFGLTRELERASFENVHTRLARLLLKKNPPPHPTQFPLPNPDKKITHADLAIQLGVSRETVSRVLSDFKRKNIIHTGYRTITVTDRDSLMQYIEDYDQW